MWGEHSPPTPSLGSANAAAAPAQPAAAGLDAETCKQTKRKRGGARGTQETPAPDGARSSCSPKRAEFY